MAMGEKIPILIGTNKKLEAVILNEARVKNLFQFIEGDSSSLHSSE